MDFPVPEGPERTIGLVDAGVGVGVVVVAEGRGEDARLKMLVGGWAPGAGREKRRKGCR